MGVRQVTLVIAAMCVLIGIAYYGYLSGRFELLYRNSDFAVEEQLTPTCLLAGLRPIDTKRQRQ